MLNTAPGTDTSHIEETERVDSIRFSGTFTSRDLEERFRQTQLGENFALVQVVLLVNALGVLLYIGADYHLFGLHRPFSTLLGLRTGICVLSLLVWARMRCAVRHLHVARFDRSLLLWSSFVAFSQVYVSFTRPQSYTGHFLVHLFTILLVYSVLPQALLRQTIPALIMSTGMLLCMILKPPAQGLTVTALGWTLVTANVLGASMSRQLQISKRRQFLALEREQQLRAGLEKTLAELKTLRGIIPICAHCKNIRDDAGSWQQLEEYIGSHSDAEFSHGICPDCIEKYFRLN